MTPRLYRGYDSPDTLRTSPDQKYTFSFDKPTKKIGLRQASIEACQEFQVRYPDKELVILYSGGLDSEWVCESFYRAGVPFTPLIVDYCGDNEHDLYWARKYLESKPDLKPIWWKFNLRKWYNSAEQLEIADKAQISELAYTGAFRALLEHQSRNRIFLNGYDEPVIQADDKSGTREWNLIFNERYYAIQKFMSVYGINTVPGGWQDSNIFSAYVRTPAWQWLVANLENPQIWNSEMVKIKLYQRAFPNLAPRPKWTGFEKMLDIVVPATQKWRKHTLEKYGTMWLEDYTRPIHEVWADLEI